MKKLMIIMTVSVFFFSCSSIYKVQSESQKAPDMSSYKTIFVGWVGFDGGQWKELGYKSQSEWESCFKEMNIDWFQADLKKRLYNKKVIFGKPGDRPAGDLAITFKNVKVTDSGMDNMQIYMDVDFFNPAAGKPVYSANIRIWGHGFGPQMYRFEGRIGFGMYNLAEFIESKLD